MTTVDRSQARVSPGPNTTEARLRDAERRGDDPRAELEALRSGTASPEQVAQAEADNKAWLEHQAAVAAEREKLKGRTWLPTDAHVSPETAYVIQDYPYGRQLRCRKRVWIETKPKHGQRVVSQTTDPKRAVEHWNKPKAGTYVELALLYLDDATGHLEYDAIGVHMPIARVDAIEAEAGEALSERARNRIKTVRAVTKAYGRLTWTVTSKAYEPVNILDKAAMAELAEREKEQEEKRKYERRLVGALIGNEVAQAHGQPLPFPKLGTADSPPPKGE